MKNFIFFSKNIIKVLFQYKYLVTLVIFIVYVGFIDEYSVVRRIGFYNRKTKLQNQIERYQKEFDESTKMLNELNENPQAIEQIAREKYLMKKPNEDVFIFED